MTLSRVYDLVVSTINGGGNIPIGELPLGLQGGGGIEALYSIRTGRYAIYGFIGGGVTIGINTGSAGVQGTLGYVFGTPDSQSYTQLFTTLSVPYLALPPDLRTLVDLHAPKLSGTNVNIFFDPNGGGSCGISFARSLVESEFASPNYSLTISYYWQLWPRHNEVVPFR